MLYYWYCYMITESGERFNFEDMGNTIVTQAETVEEAQQMFEEWVDESYIKELEKYFPPTKIEDWEEWQEKNPYYTVIE